MTISLHHFDRASGATKKSALPLNAPGDRCTVWMSPLPGASSIQLLLEGENGTPLSRIECQMPSPDSIPISIVLESDHVLHVFRPAPQELAHPLGEQFWSRADNGSKPTIYYLPSGSVYAPPRPIRFQENGMLDLLLLVDGSALLLRQDRMAKAKGDSAASGSATWAQQQEKLVEFSRLLQQRYSDLHVAVMAFGDYSLNDAVSAADLRPGYSLFPEDWQRRLRVLSEHQLRERLESIPYTSGADFVDALAEALHECQSAGWRADARKLLVLAGDSPGNSILYPLPRGADARPRSFDVDSEAASLHETQGVEILSIYLGNQQGGVLHHLADHASKQYERLASHPTLFWNAASFEPEAAAAALKNVAEGLVLARGSCYGVLDKINQG